MKMLVAFMNGRSNVRVRNGTMVELEDVGGPRPQGYR